MYSAKQRPHPVLPTGAYSFIELLVVVGILATLVAVLTPALRISRPAGNSLTQLKSTLQRARSEAIRHRTDIFVAFADSLPGIEGTPATDRYRYRAYAIFMRDASRLHPENRYLTDVLTCPVTAVSDWKLLPDGVLFALGEDISTSRGTEPILTLLDAGDPEDSLGSRGSAYRMFPLPLEGVVRQTPLPCISFNREGRIRLPTWNETRSLHLGLVSGVIREGNRTITEFIESESMSINSGSGRRKPVVDLLTISHTTGHVREVGTSARPGSQ